MNGQSSCPGTSTTDPALLEIEQRYEAEYYVFVQRFMLDALREDRSRGLKDEQRLAAINEYWQIISEIVSKTRALLNAEGEMRQAADEFKQLLRQQHNDNVETQQQQGVEDTSSNNLDLSFSLHDDEDEHNCRIIKETRNVNTMPVTKEYKEIRCEFCNKLESVRTTDRRTNYCWDCKWQMRHMRPPSEYCVIPATSNQMVCKECQIYPLFKSPRCWKCFKQYTMKSYSKKLNPAFIGRPAKREFIEAIDSGSIDWENNPLIVEPERVAGIVPQDNQAVVSEDDIVAEQMVQPQAVEINEQIVESQETEANFMEAACFPDVSFELLQTPKERESAKGARKLIRAFTAKRKYTKSSKPAPKQATISRVKKPPRTEASIPSKFSQINATPISSAAYTSPPSNVILHKASKKSQTPKPIPKKTCFRYPIRKTRLKTPARYSDGGDETPQKQRNAARNARVLINNRLAEAEQIDRYLDSMSPVQVKMRAPAPLRSLGAGSPATIDLITALSASSPVLAMNIETPTRKSVNPQRSTNNALSDQSRRLQRLELDELFDLSHRSSTSSETPSPKPTNLRLSGQRMRPEVLDIDKVFGFRLPDFSTSAEKSSPEPANAADTSISNPVALTSLNQSFIHATNLSSSHPSNAQPSTSAQPKRPFLLSVPNPLLRRKSMTNLRNPNNTTCKNMKY